MKTIRLPLAVGLVGIFSLTLTAVADPRIDSWFTTYAGKYARIYTNDASKTSVNAVAMFDGRDGYVWTGSAESGNGTGYWNRDAFVNESVTFDPGYAHQEQTGTHHYHADPIALRYLLGDHVDFNVGTRTYSEST